MRLTKVNPFATICKYAVFSSTSLKKSLLRLSSSSAGPYGEEIPHPQPALQGRKETSFFLLFVLTQSELGVASLLSLLNSWGDVLRRGRGIFCMYVLLLYDSWRNEFALNRRKMRKITNGKERNTDKEMDFFQKVFQG